MSETTPQTTTGDPVGNGTGQRRGPGGDGGRRNDYRIKQDNDEEIPTSLRNYRFGVNNTNPAETFDRVIQQIAQYIATEIQGAGYMRRPLINLEEPTIRPPAKPKAPQEPADAADDDAMAIYEIEKAMHDANLEV
jgi:hypothetical protein